MSELSRILDELYDLPTDSTEEQAPPPRALDDLPEATGDLDQFLSRPGGFATIPPQYAALVDDGHRLESFAPAPVRHATPVEAVTEAAPFQPVIEAAPVEAAIEAARFEPAAAEAPEPVLAEPVLAEPLLTEPVMPEPVLAEPVRTAQMVSDPVAEALAELMAEPVVAEPVVQPAVDLLAEAAEVAERRPWRFGDDDVIGRGRGRSRRLRLHR